MMNDRGKSDRSVVPEKLSNKADNPAAEAVEGRDRAKGNPAKRDKPWTLSQPGLPSVCGYGSVGAAGGGFPGAGAVGSWGDGWSGMMGISGWQPAPWVSRLLANHGRPSRRGRANPLAWRRRAAQR